MVGLTEITRRVSASGLIGVCYQQGSAGRHLADHAELVALLFAASRANPSVRAGLQGFVAEGQQLLADYLEARVAAGELRPTTPAPRPSCCYQTVALGQVTGTDTDPPP